MFRVSNNIFKQTYLTYHIEGCLNLIYNIQILFNNWLFFWFIFCLIILIIFLKFFLMKFIFLLLLREFIIILLLSSFMLNLLIKDSEIRWSLIMNILYLIRVGIPSSFKRSWLYNLLLALSLLLLNLKKCAILHLILISLLQGCLGSTLRDFIIVVLLIKLQLLFSYSYSLSVLPLSLLSMVIAFIKSPSSVMVCPDMSILNVFWIYLILSLNVCKIISINVII